MLVGMEKSEKFHEKREAQIRQKYNADETFLVRSTFWRT